MFQVDFDPERISFARLLEFFWESHNPCASAWSTQYKAILFYADDEQEKIARESAAAVEVRRQRPVRTELKRAGRFYFAEDYHQKYRLRGHRELYRNIRSMFESERAFAESTVAAKVNAFLDGYLTFSEVQKQLAPLGLRVVGTAKGIERIEIAPRTRAQAAASRPSAASRPTSKPSVDATGR